MYYGAWDVFIHSAFFGGLTTIVLGLLFVGLIMYAEYRAECDAWEQQKTRKLKAVRR
jgi:hypothetical protein